MFEWILMLMVFIDKMVCLELKAMRTKRMKFIRYVAARLGIREGTENLVDLQKESGEEYALRKENPRIPEDCHRRKTKKEGRGR